MQRTRTQRILHEFRHHFPFTILAAVIAILVLGFYSELLNALAHNEPGHAETAAEVAVAGHIHESSPFTRLFHLFHPLHVLLSASATAAMFWRYDRRLVRTLIVSVLGSVGLCGVADIFFPFLGGTILGMKMELHICIIEHPHLIWPFAAVGIAAGMLAADAFNHRGVSVFSHAAHVLVSTGGAILYLVGYGLINWSGHLVGVFSILIFSVLIPCCTSDIIFPLFLANPKGLHWCSGECDHDHGEEVAA
jgi:hypothetical protein